MKNKVKSKHQYNDNQGDKEIIKWLVCELGFLNLIEVLQEPGQAPFLLG